MSDVNEVLSLYKSSSFYKKYKDTYFSDIILRDALKCKNSIHRYYGLNKMSYEDVHRLSTDVLRDLFNKFANPSAMLYCTPVIFLISTASKFGYLTS